MAFEWSISFFYSLSQEGRGSWVLSSVVDCQEHSRFGPKTGEGREQEAAYYFLYLTQGTGDSLFFLFI